MGDEVNLLESNNYLVNIMSFSFLSFSFLFLYSKAYEACKWRFLSEEKCCNGLMLGMKSTFNFSEKGK